ncbi:hypothetical protein GTY62_15265 [Streptomyces sp. SID724]|uniref:hypothetical protein n=1 Tax=Streptomyces sp. SID724 TaxID=2690324 RepID=UPI0013616E6C|nr:hypothetical protein [Streptomyces sp. SID724]
MAAAYSGALGRAAHFAHRPPVPGINPEHEKPDPDPDPFTPMPEGVQPAAYDMWQDREFSAHTEMQQRPFNHWGYLQQPVPSSVPSEVAGIATTTRMLHNHGQVDYRPDLNPTYKHATEGKSIEYVTGRGSVESGENIPDELTYLVAGTNAYDFTNQPNEVYSADQGRYRLGTKIDMFGLYEFWTQQGQDAELRAYTGLYPATPVDKARVEDSAPYTPNSSGTTTWLQDVFQVPSMFALPSETQSTDYEVATGGVQPGGGFDDGGRM